MTELGNAGKQQIGHWANNRVENSHLPFRRRERVLLRFRQMKSLQKFASGHANGPNHFNQDAPRRPTDLQSSPHGRTGRVASSHELSPSQPKPRLDCAETGSHQTDSTLQPVREAVYRNRTSLLVASTPLGGGCKGPYASTVVELSLPAQQTRTHQSAHCRGQRNAKRVPGQHEQCRDFRTVQAVERCRPRPGSKTSCRPCRAQPCRRQPAERPEQTGENRC